MTVCEITRPADGFASVFGASRGGRPVSSSPDGTHLVYSCSQVECVFWLDFEKPYLLMVSDCNDEYVSGTRKLLGYGTVENSPYSGEGYSPIAVAMDMREPDCDISHFFEALPGDPNYAVHFLSIGKLLASRASNRNVLMTICKSYNEINLDDIDKDEPFREVSEDSLLRAEIATGLFVG